MNPLPGPDVAKLFPTGSPILRSVPYGAAAAVAVGLPGHSPWHNLVLAGYVPDTEDLSLILRAWTKATRLHLLTHSEDGCPDDWDCQQDADLYDWIPQFIDWEADRYGSLLKQG